MIKLISLINELGINNPRITPRKALDYLNNNIDTVDFSINTGQSSDGWKEYIKTCQPYCKKYDIIGCLRDLYDFEKLSQQDLINLFNEMRQLVKKHGRKEVLNELSINNPLVTAEKAEQYYWDNIFKNDIEFSGSSNGWHEYRQICQPYCKKYDLGGWVGRGNFKYLSQQELIKFYNDVRQLVKKRVGKEVLNELNIAKPIQTYDVREENWSNLSSAIFDRIEIGDKIIDSEFIGTVYKKEFDDLLGLMCIEYVDDKDKDNAKFLSRDWFDYVSRRKNY